MFESIKNISSLYGKDAEDDLKYLIPIYPNQFASLINHWQTSREGLTEDYQFYLDNGRTMTTQERINRRMNTPSTMVIKDYVDTDPIPDLIWYSDFSFDPLPTEGLFNFPNQVRTLKKLQKEEKQGEDPMYFHFDTHTPLEQQQIQFAFSYASEAYSDVNSSFRKKFNMDRSENPSTAKELVEMIQKGQFKLLDDDEAKSIADYVSIDQYYDDGHISVDIPRLKFVPDWKKDRDGFNAAIEAVDTEYAKLKATIMAGDYAKSIAAVDAFSAKYAN